MLRYCQVPPNWCHNKADKDKEADNRDGLSDKESANFDRTFVVRANVCLSHQYWSPAEHTAAITSAWSAPA